MKKYLFEFGYMTPRQLELNEKFGWDDEDSQAIWIMADSEEGALEWGRSLAEVFLRLLFNDDTVSWQRMNFAHWVTSEDQTEDDPARLTAIPLVNYGEFPDWEKLLP